MRSPRNAERYINLLTDFGFKRLFGSEPNKRLFEVAEIARFSPVERESYESSLKYYRDLKNVVDTSREEGLEAGLAQGREQQTLTLVIRLLKRRLGQELAEEMRSRLSTLPLPTLEELSEALLDFSTLADLEHWLAAQERS